MKRHKKVRSCINTMDKKTPEQLEVTNTQKALPFGMGYKSCWMVVENATQKNVMSAFLQGRKMKYPYMKGLEKVKNVNSKDKKLLVTGTHKKQNYVIGDAVSEFFYETEEFLAKCKEFSRVYVYMTHRVSETHGFALIEHGELVRLFCYDENEIKNIGEPLPEEIALGYRLPKNFDDVWDKDGNFTYVNEDVIVSLAIQQMGIDVEKYPYKEVRVGKLFEYEADLSADPYPEDTDYDEIPEEIMNLPEVQRFLNTETPEEKLAIAEELKDVITHPMLDAFGEIVAARPSYNRLSVRYEELLTMIRSAIHMKSLTINHEKFLEELSNGVYEFEDKIFKDVIFQNMKCEQLIFNSCIFENCKLGDNPVTWRIAFNDFCSFYDCVFHGKWEDILLEMNDCYFYTCNIHDFEFSGFTEQSEMIGGELEDCTFSNVNINADLCISGVSMEYCTGEQMECIMNMMLENNFKYSKFKNIRLGVAIIRNSFKNVEIENMQNIDFGEEPVRENNTFENCHINNELRNG